MPQLRRDASSLAQQTIKTERHQLSISFQVIIVLIFQRSGMPLGKLGNVYQVKSVSRALHRSVRPQPPFKRAPLVEGSMQGNKTLHQICCAKRSHESGALAPGS